MTEVQTLIQQLGLMPHPEGGWYRELHRSSDRIQRQDGAERSALTAILFCYPQVPSVAGTGSSVLTKPGRTLTGHRWSSFSARTMAQGCDVMP